MCDALPKCIAHPSAIIFLKHYINYGFLVIPVPTGAIFLHGNYKRVQKYRGGRACSPTRLFVQLPDGKQQCGRCLSRIRTPETPDGLKAKTLNAEKQAIAVTSAQKIGLHGMGGIAKSVLETALARIVF